MGKQTKAGRAVSTLEGEFAKDADYRHSWVANIAMVIYDNWPKKGRLIDKANLCADKIMNHCFGRRQP